MKRPTILIVGSVRGVTRDPMHLLIFSAPLLILVILRFGIPQFADVLATQLSFDLSPYYRLIFIFFCGLLPMMFGMLIGFIMLDEQDEHILQYVAVTPLSRAGYLWIKFSVPTLVIFLFALVFMPASGIVNFKIGRFIPVALVLATEAPLLGIFLVGFASNKVEGLAMAKGAGIYIVAPIVGYFIHSPLQYIAGLSPVFWPAKAYLTDSLAGYLIYLGIGLIVHLAWFMPLYWKFSQKILQ